MVMAAIAVGHIAMLAHQAQERLRQAAEIEAANRERERLARGIHDSVLQVLALVQRRGAELGGEAAELGRLAGEQEAALRALVQPGGRAGGTPVRHGRPARGRSAPYAGGVTCRRRPAHRRSGCRRPPPGSSRAAVGGRAGQRAPPLPARHARAWMLVEDEPARSR